LNTYFKISDLGPLFYFLGITTTRDEAGRHLSQECYTEEIFRRFQFTSSHSISTATKFKEDTGVLLSQQDATLYRSIVDSMYPMLATRPDLVYVRRVFEPTSSYT